MLKTWISSSYERHFPQTQARSRKSLKLDVARNERFNFQVVMRHENGRPLPVKVAVDLTDKDFAVTNWFYADALIDWYKSQTRELIDPFTVSDGCNWSDWAYGDTFQDYPGPDGPIDSVRWEVFAESLQDYRLLQTLGIDRNVPRLAPVKSFRDFPKNERWRKQFKRSLLMEATQ